MTNPGHSNPELEARLLANPNDLAAYLVYSDWLIERGDPRGELIAVQAKLHETPLDVILLASEEHLLKAHRGTWLGPLATIGPADLGCSWHLGFLEAVRIGPKLDLHKTSAIDFGDTFAKLLTLPHVSFLREVVVGSKYYDDYPTSWEDVLIAIEAHGVPPRLRRLVFDCGGYWDISSTELGNLSRTYPRLGSLHELRIRMGSLELGPTVDLPELRSLEIETGGLKSEDVAAIAASAWPRLERLSLCIGETGNDYGCTVGIEHLAPIFEGANLPHVRHLGLRNASFTDTIAAELPGSKILPQLETLDLSLGTLGDEGARSLIEQSQAFAHLKRIDLTHHYVSADVAEELRRAMKPEIVLTDAQEADVDGDEVYRFVRITE
jgi:uncharacterized protein (TIGR02996 family)